MSHVVLSAEDLGKQYFLSHRAARYDSLREILAAGLRRIASGARAASPRETATLEEFWALRHLSLEVKQGDVLGVIGRNGAGKSTLLKIISRITEPTEGRLRLRGRAASLLEVGTGFHSELTGRENIYLNGAILGMPKTEIRAKFDQIVAFAEVDRFLDTPVKRYSSGMYVRLAFAVAAHLEPEILIVDEVLAVGDANFQKKCLDRMAEVAKQGRTILFVSHNLGLVRTLCKRGVLLQNGGLAYDGTAEAAIARYLEDLEGVVTTDLLKHTPRLGSGKSRLARIEIMGATDTQQLETGQPARIVFHASAPYSALSCVFTIYDSFGQAVASFDSALMSSADRTDATGGPRFVCDFDELLLIPGSYRINAGLVSDDELLDRIDGAAMLEVGQGLAGARPVVTWPDHGSVAIPHRWTRPC